MPIITDCTLTLEPPPAAKRRGGLLSRLDDRPAWREMYESAVVEARELVRPAIAYDVQPVTGVDAETLRVAGGHVLESPVVASLFGGAPEVLLTIFTIGPLLEQRVSELQAKGDHPAAFALDIVGALAVNEVGKEAARVIEEVATSKGVRASIPLNPGTTHWPISGNDVLVELTPAAEIGVEVLDSGLLRPYKSISYAVALGKDVLTPEQGSSCDYCDTRELCRL